MSRSGNFGSEGSPVIAVPVGGAYSQGGSLQGCWEPWSSECQRAGTSKVAGWTMRGSVDQIRGGASEGYSSGPDWNNEGCKLSRGSVMEWWELLWEAVETTEVGERLDGKG